MTRARLAAIVTASSDAIIGETLDGIITDWNPGAERLYGYAAAEAVGQPLNFLAPSERAGEIAELLERVCRGESIADLETVRRTKSGRLIDVSVTISPVRAATGQIIAASAITRDITARKASERSLAESAGLFRTAFADAPIGMGLFRLDRTTLQVNRALCALLGYSEAELLAAKFLDLTHPEDVELTIAHVDHVLSGESDTYTYEKRFIRKNGQIIWVLVSGSLVHDDEGVPQYFTSQMLDITERREAEIERAATQQHTRQVLERITDGFYALDRDWRFTYVNEAAERMLGRRRDELLHQNAWEAFPPAVETPLYAAYHEALAYGITTTVELFYPPLESWFEVRAYPSPEGLSVFFRDITDSRQIEQTLRASESKYRTLIDHLPAVTYLLAADEPQTALYFSPRLEDLTGFRPEEALVRRNGWHWIETIHPDDRDRVAVEDARTVTAGEAFRMEYRYLRKDGSYVWVLDECVPVHDDSGQIVAWQGVLLDISERVQAEEGRARLAAIVESAEDGIYTATRGGTITSWNHGAERLYGYAVDEAIGQNVMMLGSPERSDDITHMVERAWRGERVAGHQTVRRTKDGRLIDVSLAISPVRDPSGNVAAVSTITRDVTALRRAEAALRLRDRALAATTNGIVIIDPSLPDRPIVDVNPAFELLSGYTRDEAVGRSIPMLYGPGTDPVAVQRIREAILAGRDITETLLTYRQDGTPFWSHHNVAAVRDDAGSLTHYVGVMTDVSERVETEATLAQERDLLQTLLEHLPDAVYIKDTASRFLRINQATARELGIADPAEAIGKTDRDFWPETLAEEYVADERRLLETGEPMLNKLEQQREHGDPRWVLATKVPLRDATGEIVGLVGVNRDVTERLRTDEARARLAAIIESAEDAIISRTLDGTITSWNRGAEKLYGYRADEAIGHPFTMLLPDDEQLTAQAATERFGAPATQFETTRRRQDGTLVDVSIAMSPIRDDEGVTIGVSTITRDITDLKRLEHDLRSALEGAQAATRTKSQFLAMMSHELRTPLQAVLGYADLLLLRPKGSFSDEQAEDIGYIQGGATRMMTLIGQLLDLSRMEAGRLDLAEEPVDLVKIIEQVRQDVAPQVGAKGLDLRIDLPPSLPLVVGDPDRLRQILLNLVGNAVKFTEEGSVGVSACRAEDGVDIDVRDTGIGITEEAMPHIFEEFRQVDGNLTRRYGGAGLGLAIAHKLAEQMGGSITVVSQHGAGSTFTLHLPAVATARSTARRD